MRAQYHFRHSERGLLAWDVRRLVERVKELEVEEVPLSAIAELDEAFWFDAKDGSPTCRDIAGHARLIEAADLTWPIILDPAGRVMDGMHRVCKALLLGMSSIRAYRLPQLPPPDFIGVAPRELPYD